MWHSATAHAQLLILIIEWKYPRARTSKQKRGWAFQAGESTSGQVWVLDKCGWWGSRPTSANLILTPQMMSNMTDYLNVPPTQRFFIKYGGKELDHLADRLEERFQFEFLASTKYRKLVATHVTSRKTLDTEKRRLVDVSQFSYGGNTTTEPSTIHTAYDLINGSRLLKPKQEP